VNAAAGCLALLSACVAAWIGEQSSLIALAVLAASRVAATLIFRLDRLYWPDLTFRDMVTAILAVCGGTAIAGALTATLPGPCPARLLAADFCVCALLTLLCAALPRLGSLRARAPSQRATRALIWGAGETGRALLARLRANPDLDIFGWLDDAPALAEIDRDGVPVLGPLESLPLLTELHGIRRVLVAIPSLGRERRAFAEDLARWSGAELIFSPGYSVRLGTQGGRSSRAETQPIER
jgi:FlaA1/EpsC-like NDP-sugar epimerase